MNAARDLISREQLCTLADLDSGVQFTVQGPAILRANGLRVEALGGDGSGDFGALPLWYAPNVATPIVNCQRFHGNYAYLPAGGSWYVFRAFAGVASAASPVVDTDLVHFTVFENASAELYQSIALNTIPAFSYTTQTPIIGQVALDATGAADSFAKGGVVRQGDYFHIIGADITNTGANAMFVFTGNGGLVSGHRLAANTSVLFPPGCLTGLSSLYAVSALGATAQTIWYVK